MTGINTRTRALWRILMMVDLKLESPAAGAVLEGIDNDGAFLEADSARRWPETIGSVTPRNRGKAVTWTP
jgi:hypothetical protein